MMPTTPLPSVIESLRQIGLAPRARLACGTVAEGWLWNLDQVSAAADAMRPLLDPMELYRVSRLRSALHRERFLLSHGIVRHALAALGDYPPSAIVFSNRPYGKPAIAAPHHMRALKFNLSHTQNWLALIVSQQAEVGIDIEVTADKRRNIAILAEQICTPSELRDLVTLPTARQGAAFLQLWVAKEAVLKALGTGFQVDPRTIAPSALDGVELVPVAIHPLLWDGTGHTISAADFQKDLFISSAVAHHLSNHR